MRTEQEMMELILSTARQDDRIRAVFLNGSRANPNAPRDLFQDYDVAYFVRDLESFLAESIQSGPEWLSRFGEELIFQFPDLNDEAPPIEGACAPAPRKRLHFGILMQFTDGSRIDLSLNDKDLLSEYLREDSLTVKLLDKDGLTGELPPPTDEDYWVKRPTAGQYAACVNEFYWVSNYVAKGLWRRELTYAHETLDHYVREMLLTVLSWRVGVDTGFSLSVGKCGKYLEKHLPPEDFARLKRTYAGGEYGDIWNALFEMQALFRDTAVYVGGKLGYPFPQRWHDNVTQFCREIQVLPQDAREIR